MLKRLLALLIVGLVFCSATAFAEGKLKATQKTLIVNPGSTNGYFFAKIENVGDAVVSMSSSDLVIFTEDDEILLTESYINTYPSSVLFERGDYLYVYEWLYDSKLKTAVVTDYKFSVSKDRSKTSITKVDCEVELSLSGAGSYNNYAYITFTNATDKPIKDFYVSVALYDEQENLICVDTASYTSITIHPNSTVTVDLSIDNDYLVYCEMNKLVVTSADAIVCCKNE